MTILTNSAVLCALSLHFLHRPSFRSHQYRLPPLSFLPHTSAADKTHHQVDTCADEQMFTGPVQFEGEVELHHSFWDKHLTGQIQRRKTSQIIFVTPQLSLDGADKFVRKCLDL